MIFSSQQEDTSIRMLLISKMQGPEKTFNASDNQLLSPLYITGQ